MGPRPVCSDVATRGASLGICALAVAIASWGAPAGAAPPLAAWPGLRPTHGDSERACLGLETPPQRMTDMEVHASLGTGLGKLAELVVFGPLTVLTPHPGLLVRDSGAELSLSWSGSIPVGPITSCKRIWGGVDLAYGHRLLLESTLVPARPRTFATRAGYRYVHHPSAWRVGVGAGLAGALEVGGPRAVRAGVSPELALHVGRCCGALYWLLSVRWDRYFSGADRDQLNVSLGLVFF